MTIIGIAIHRIDADPVDCPDGETLALLAERGLVIEPATWKVITGFLPDDRQRTRVRLNQKDWPSASEYLAAMADAEDVASLIQRLPSDGWLDRRDDWAAAERQDNDRAGKGLDRMLDWHRPLVRLGAHIRVTSDEPLADDATDRIIDEFNEVLILDRQAQEICFVLRGTPQDVESRTAAALTAQHGGPRW